MFNMFVVGSNDTQPPCLFIPCFVEIIPFTVFVDKQLR